MRPVKILTDSCCDLSSEIREKYGIDYVKMNICIEGEEIPASLDWENHTPSELYDGMREGKRITTTQVSVTTFTEKLEELISDGFDVVYIGCSGALSGSVNTAKTLFASFAEAHPEANLFAVDSCRASLGEGLIAVKAAELGKEGKSAAEIAEYIENNKLRVYQYGTVNTLDYLKRAGRVKASAAFFGNLFGVKPILSADENGNNVAIKKVKGRFASIDESVNLLGVAMKDSTDNRVFLGHADCSDEDINYLVAKVKEVIGTDNIYVNFVGPIIGASVGPGTIVMYGWGNN